MRKRYRSQASIIRDILGSISKESRIRPSRLACCANLPYDRLQQYLELLVKKGYLHQEISNDGRWYSLTNRGLKP